MQIWLDISLTAVPIFISIYALVIARKSNETAKDANLQSKAQFALVNRPRLVVQHVPFENGKYWKVTRENLNLYVEVLYSLENVGYVTAINIRYDKEKEFFVKHDKKIVRPVEAPSDIALSPNRNIIIVEGFNLVYESEESAKSAENEYNNDPEFIEKKRSFTVNYTSEVDRSRKYRTVFIGRLHPYKSEILDMKHLVQGVDY